MGRPRFCPSPEQQELLDRIELNSADRSRRNELILEAVVAGIPYETIGLYAHLTRAGVHRVNQLHPARTPGDPLGRGR